MRVKDFNVVVVAVSIVIGPVLSFQHHQQQQQQHHSPFTNDFIPNISRTKKNNHPKQQSSLLTNQFNKRPYNLHQWSLAASLDTASFQDEESSTTTTTSSVTAFDWSFLDGVYLITCPNADSSQERMEQARQVLSSANLQDKLIVKEFATDDSNRIRGCYNSHISVIRDVLDNVNRKQKSNKDPFQNLYSSIFKSNNDQLKRTKNNVDNNNNDNGDDVKILILEDNVASSGSLNSGIVDAVAKFVTNNNTPWDMVHLSYIPYVPDLVVTKTSDDNIVRLNCGVGSSLGTTAYIINKRGMERLLQQDKESNGFYAAIPDVMAKIFPDTRYAAYPTIFVRAPKVKSLVNPQLDDLRATLFQPAVVSFAQSLLATTGLSTNNLLPLVIGVLLIATVGSAKLTIDSFTTLITTGSFDGPFIVPILSTSFTLFALALILQGMILAPKPEPEK